ncbi:hypothetical protein LZ31DRAFT_287464 [Colletotrichum somersetense]|nr:hypothetical protein LZ31DRAFT_287464 [Colletotrichum somersetense]
MNAPPPRSRQRVASLPLSPFLIQRLPSWQVKNSRYVRLFCIQIPRPSGYKRASKNNHGRTRSGVLDFGRGHDLLWVGSPAVQKPASRCSLDRCCRRRTQVTSLCPQFHFLEHSPKLDQTLGNISSRQGLSPLADLTRGIHASTAFLERTVAWSPYHGHTFIGLSHQDWDRDKDSRFARGN